MLAYVQWLSWTLYSLGLPQAMVWVLWFCVDKYIWLGAAWLISVKDVNLSEDGIKSSESNPFSNNRWSSSMTQVEKI